MSRLLLKGTKELGKVFDITPNTAGWSFVGFKLFKLKKGETLNEATKDQEVILVLIEGLANIRASGIDFGELGERISVFERLPPYAVYVPHQSNWTAVALSDLTIGVCSAPGGGDYKAQQLGPKGIELQKRGKGSNTRYIYNIAMEDRDVAKSLLVTEVFTPSGNWSSYPPHRHDKDDFPNTTYLEETYYHRLNPPNGFGMQRVFSEDGSIDETISFGDGDMVLVPKGHHPCAAPYGFELYYLNVMAGPIRKWRFKNHPDYQWLYDRDN